MMEKEENIRNVSYHYQNNMVSRVPKLIKPPRERKISEESKNVADALNQQAKEYKENPPKNEDENFLNSLKEIKEKYPPKEISEETANANLSLWGMRNSSFEQHQQQQPQQTNDYDVEMEGKKYDNKKMTQIKSNEVNSKSTINWTKESENVSENYLNEKNSNDNIISEMFRDLVENGGAISIEESKNLQNLFGKVFNKNSKTNRATETVPPAAPPSPRPPVSVSETYSNQNTGFNENSSPRGNTTIEDYKSKEKNYKKKTVEVNEADDDDEEDDDGAATATAAGAKANQENDKKNYKKKHHHHHQHHGGGDESETTTTFLNRM